MTMNTDSSEDQDCACRSSPSATMTFGDERDGDHRRLKAEIYETYARQAETS